MAPPVKTAVKPKRPAPKKATKATAKKSAAKKSTPTKAAKKSPARKPVAKADGDAPVRAYIESLPAWQEEVARRVDRIVAREVPGLRRAVKWSAAFYGVPDQGWFASMKGFNKHLKVTFFRGTSLKPVPPSGEHEAGRSLDIREGEALDEARMASWIRQAAALPGWGS